METTPNVEIQYRGPHADLSNPEHLVLQRMGTEPLAQEWEKENDDWGDYDSSSEGMDPVVAEKSIAVSTAAEVIKTLEAKGGAFVHTAEYYAAIKEEAERMKAYKSIIVTGQVPDGEESEVIKDPLKFLNLPPDAPFKDLRVAWMTLSRIWHYDMMRPEDTARFKLIFGDTTPGKFVIDETDPKDWIKAILEAKPPEIKEVADIEALTEDARAEYVAAREAYKQREDEYKKVKAEMVSRAHEKLVLINLAYKTAKARYGKEDHDSFGGFQWQEGSLDSIILRSCHGLKFTFKSLPLEGGAELRQDTGRFATNDDTYIAYDMGDVYLADTNDFRQRLPIKAFFAWMELSQLGPLSPLLLTDIAKKCQLDDSQIEQLRIMLMNREDTEFILKALNIATDKNDGRYLLPNFIDLVYNGPHYALQFGVGDSLIYPLGVELTPDGGMKFHFQNQKVQAYADVVHNDQVKFTPTDMNVMRAVAYGPLLQAMPE